VHMLAPGQPLEPKTGIPYMVILSMGYLKYGILFKKIVRDLF